MSGHVWQADEAGALILFAMDVEPEGHKGGHCVACGFLYCVTCADAEDSPCPGGTP